MAILRHDRDRYDESRTTPQQSPARPWREVSAAMDRLDYQTALSLAQQLVAKQPNYYYGHAYLGSIYLGLGDVTNAERQFLRAYELWPDEENEKSLAAIRKRLAREASAAPK